MSSEWRGVGLELDRVGVGLGWREIGRQHPLFHFVGHEETARVEWAARVVLKHHGRWRTMKSFSGGLVQ